ncbi:MAG: hypothetical protein JNK35_11130 [Phycisphaerae bacterium]|nr:hypothetical protein [Phycisphaerae bacterium]
MPTRRSRPSPQGRTARALPHALPLAPALLLTALAPFAPALAQPDPTPPPTPPTPPTPIVEPPPQRLAPIGLDSGPLPAPEPTPSSPRGTPVLLFTTDLHAPGAAWLRVPLHGLTLAGNPAMGDGAFIRLTAYADGDHQRLDADTLHLWQHASAFFSGDRLRLELFAFPGTGESRIAIPAIIAGEPPLELPQTICGSTDDRQPISDPRIARGGGGCTAWIINDLNGGFLSAGHCLSAVSSLLLFNVPPSLPNGSQQQPPVADQFPVDLASGQSQNGGIGADFAYLGALPNSQHGLLPFQRYGVRFTLAAAPPATPPPAIDIRISGHGSASGVRNFVLQTHVGPFVSFAGSRLQYRTDTTGGNSGSPVVRDDSGLAIGIHTHGGCTSTGGANSGTAISYAALQTALNNPRSVCASGRGTVAGSLFAIGDRQNNFGTVSPAPLRFARIAQLGAFWQGLAFNPATNLFFAVDSAVALFTISPSGALTTLGTLTLPDGAPVGTILTGLAFVPSTGTLFATAPATGQLYRLDPASLTATPLGPPRGGALRALDYDALRRRLVGIETAGTQRLVAIDPFTGARSPIANLSSANTIGDIAFDHADGHFRAVNAADGTLLRIDALTGVVTSLGPTGGVFGPASGLASSSTCRADFNADGEVSPDDLADFIACFFASPPCAAANMNADAATDPDDLSDYISLYFDGCG